jgi:hypothetical protein
LQIKWFNNVSEKVLIDRFSPQNCPIKKIDGKWLVQKDRYESAKPSKPIEQTSLRSRELRRGTAA